MTPAAFRRMALALTGAEERAHHGHPDFRVGGRIFATLGYPDRQSGVAMLTPEQQRQLVREHGEAFFPVKGKWGEAGATVVRLPKTDEEAVGQALTLAWQNQAAQMRPGRATRQSQVAGAETPRAVRARRTTPAPRAGTRRPLAASTRRTR